MAIENVRLVDETKAALELQKASAEILSVISQSMGETEQVFSTILACGLRLVPDIDAVQIEMLDAQGQVQFADCCCITPLNVRANAAVLWLSGS